MLIKFTTISLLSMERMTSLSVPLLQALASILVLREKALGFNFRGRFRLHMLLQSRKKEKSSLLPSFKMYLVLSPGVPLKTILFLSSKLQFQVKNFSQKQNYRPTINNGFISLKMMRAKTMTNSSILSFSLSITISKITTILPSLRALFRTTPQSLPWMVKNSQKSTAKLKESSSRQSSVQMKEAILTDVVIGVIIVMINVKKRKNLSRLHAYKLVMIKKDSVESMKLITKQRKMISYIISSRFSKFVTSRKT